MEESSLNTCLQILLTFTPFIPVILVCSSALNVTDANWFHYIVRCSTWVKMFFFLCESKLVQNNITRELERVTITYCISGSKVSLATPWPDREQRSQNSRETRYPSLMLNEILSLMVFLSASVTAKRQDLEPCYFYPLFMLYWWEFRRNIQHKTLY